MSRPIPAYPLESFIYLRVNSERKGTITGHLYRPGGAFLYLVSWDEPLDEHEHWPHELTDERQYRSGDGVSGSEDGL